MNDLFFILKKININLKITIIFNDSFSHTKGDLFIHGIYLTDFTQ